MKSVIDVEKHIKDEHFFAQQFEYHHDDCNILFVSPYKNSKGLYKYLLPYILMNNDGIAMCSLTGLEKYDEERQYSEIETPLTSKQIQWADIIVFPFTTQPLWSDNDEDNLYKMIRKLNPNIRIIYNVDFNFYLLGKDHPQIETFTKKTVSHIEDNIYYSDLTLCSNMLLVDYLNEKLQKLKTTKYKGIETPAQISSFPILIDEDIFLENVLQNEPNKVEPTQNDNLRIGIVATPALYEDLKAFSKELVKVKKELGDKLEIVIMGFDGIHPKTKKSCFPKDFEFTYVKPCTIVHWMRQLDMQSLDALFIPLRFTEYNYTSEDFNKLLEAAILKVPVITTNIFPYNQIIENGKTGIILENKSHIVDLLKELGMKKAALRSMGEAIYSYVATGLTCHPQNMILMKGIYSGVDVKKFLHNQVEEKANRDKEEQLAQHKAAEEQAKLKLAQQQIEKDKKGGQGQAPKKPTTKKTTKTK